MKHQITKKQFTEAMKKAVKGAGVSHKYTKGTPVIPNNNAAENTNCLYAHKTNEGPKPGCLIGTALFHCGVTVDELAKHEGMSAHSLLSQMTDLPHEVLFAARDAQQVQDAGKTWGEALATYILRRDA